MFQSSGSNTMGITTGIEFGPDAFDKSREPSWELQKYYAVSD